MMPNHTWDSYNSIIQTESTGNISILQFPTGNGHITEDQQLDDHKEKLAVMNFTFRFSHLQLCGKVLEELLVNYRSVGRY